MIELHGDDNDAVTAMIHFCYHFDYTEPATLPMTFHVRMFTVGEKYLIPALQSLAASRFRRTITAKWEIADFTSSVREVYEETTDPQRLLKSAVIEASTSRSAELFGADGNVDFSTMADELPRYAMDVLRDTNKSNKRKRDEDEGPWSFKCFINPSCAGRFTVKQREKSGIHKYECALCKHPYGFSWNQPTGLELFSSVLIR